MRRRRTVRGAGETAALLAAALLAAVPAEAQRPPPPGAGRPARAYTPTLEDVAAASARVRAWVESGRIPGAVLSVRQRGVEVYEASYGWAQTHRYGSGQYTDGHGSIERLADPVPMTVETVFDLASVTKVMATTTAVAVLVDRGLLDVEAPVRRYLPDFTSGGKDAITLRHLLTHRSGLSQWQPVYYHADADAGAYAYVRDLPLAWPVGEGRHYSDLGFMVLGRIVEQVTGGPLEAFVEREVYRPLGLVSTGFFGTEAARRDRPEGLRFATTSHGNPFEHRMVHDPAFGYRIEGDPDAWNGWRRYTLWGEVNDGNAHHAFGGSAGHAGLFSTAGELQTLLRLWMQGGSLDGRRYFGEEVADLFLTSTGDGQALGWQLPDYAPDGSFAHTGFTGTFVLADPASRLGVVLLTNRLNGGVDEETAYPDVGPLQREVSRILTGVGPEG